MTMFVSFLISIFLLLVGFVLINRHEKRRASRTHPVNSKSVQTLDPTPVTPKWAINPALFKTKSPHLQELEVVLQASEPLKKEPTELPMIPFGAFDYKATIGKLVNDRVGTQQTFYKGTRRKLPTERRKIKAFGH